MALQTWKNGILPKATYISMADELGQSGRASTHANAACSSSTRNGTTSRRIGIRHNFAAPSSRMDELAQDPQYRNRQMTQVHGKGTFVRSLESLKFFSLHLGVTAGSAGLARTVFAPLYRAQILMQIRDISVRDTRYMSAADYLWRAAQREGFTSHWRGNGASVLRLLPEAALKFAIFDQYQVLFAPRDKDQNEAWNTVLKTGLGISTALFTTATVYPLDLAAARLAADQTGKGCQRIYRGVTDTLHLTYRREGILGPWKGLGASLALVIPHYATQIQAYYWLTLHMPRGIESKQAWWYPWLKIGMGSVAGAIATAVSYPIDTVRRRAQVSGALGYEEAIPRGVVGGVAAVIRDDGLRGLYRGCSVAMLRAVPASALHFLLYDALRSGAIMTAPSTAPSL